jgi:hypothetical protein
LLIEEMIHWLVSGDRPIAAVRDRLLLALQDSQANPGALRRAHSVGSRLGGGRKFDCVFGLPQAFTSLLPIQLDCVDFPAGCDEGFDVPRKCAGSACRWFHQSEMIHDGIELTLHPYLPWDQFREIGTDASGAYHHDRGDCQKIAQGQRDIHDGISLTGRRRSRQSYGGRERPTKEDDSKPRIEPGDPKPVAG